MDINNLVTDYYDMVYKVAYSKTRDYNDAVDITQEVFLKLLEHQNRFVNEEHVKNWLLRVTTNVFLKSRASGWKQNTVLLTDELTGFFEETESRFSYRDTYSFDNDIAEAMQSLSDQEQEMIRLFYYEGFSLRDIARMKDLNIGTLKMRMSRARNKMKDALSDKHAVAGALFENLNSRLQIYFKEKEKIMRKKGFWVRRRKETKKAALLLCDMANGWTQPGHPFSCQAEEAIKANCELLSCVRNKGNIPVLFGRTIYKNRYKNYNMNMRDGRKLPSDNISQDNYWTEIDSRLNVQPEELVFSKNCMSCFGSDNFKAYLDSTDVDTLIVTGLTASGAVRHTIMDAYSVGYNVIAVSEAIADRIPGAVAWNLFDVQVYFAEVMSLKQIKDFIQSL